MIFYVLFSGGFIFWLILIRGRCVLSIIDRYLVICMKKVKKEKENKCNVIIGILFFLKSKWNVVIDWIVLWDD